MSTATPKQFVFLSWKDIKHPQAGGAEIVHQELSTRLVKNGHTVIHLVPGYPDCPAEEAIDGIRIIRIGHSVLNFYQLPFYYHKYLRTTTDYLLDVFCCFGSFAALFGSRVKTFLFIHHIQGRIWFLQTTPPFVFPLNYVGWLLEKIQLWLLALFFKGEIITISNSTKNEIESYGFRQKINLISEGVHLKPLKSLPAQESKYPNFTVLFVGRLNKMKQPLEAVKAFSIFNKECPDSQMLVAGYGSEMTEIKEFIKANKLEESITMLGRVDDKTKLELLQKSHVLLVTSIKEGWGLVVTEANSTGTPCLTYNAPGLRDSNQEGLVTTNNSPEQLAVLISKIHNSPTMYAEIREKSFEHAKGITFDQSFKDLKELL